MSDVEFIQKLIEQLPTVGVLLYIAFRLDQRLQQMQDTILQITLKLLEKLDPDDPIVRSSRTSEALPSLDSEGRGGVMT